MKVYRFNFYRDGMEPEPSGDWICASHLPKHIQEEYVQERKWPGDIKKDGDDDEDAGLDRG